jgi:hypothetical protein
MSRLFAEAFLTPLLPDDTEEPDVRYDEDRALNVLADGSPFIAVGQRGGTVTFTEVRNEADDADPEGDNCAVTLTTVTKVKAERDDFARGASLGTSTETRVRNEPDDEDRDARAADGVFNLATWTATKSSVGTEPDDQDRDIISDDGSPHLETVTQTFVRAEAEDDDRDGVMSLGPTTKTSVKGEADDFWSEDDALLPRVGPARLVL